MEILIFLLFINLGDPKYTSLLETYFKELKTLNRSQTRPNDVHPTRVIFAHKVTIKTAENRAVWKHCEALDWNIPFLQDRGDQALLHDQSYASSVILGVFL